MKQNTANTDLKKAGLKVTLPRVSILEILEEAEQHHMSAEDVYKTLLSNGNEIGLATVYRVLTQFEAAGLVTRHHFDGGQAIFELDTGDNHDHIVCLKTGKVAEFKDPVIEERLEQIAKDLGYTLNDHKIVLYGEVMEAVNDKPRLQVRSSGPKKSS
ncbi:MAG: ferric iron uptake transcriptional regulator [Granulosicoccus sp.]